MAKRNLLILTVFPLILSGCMATKAATGFSNFTKDMLLGTIETTGKVTSTVVVGAGKGTNEVLKGVGGMVNSSAKAATEPASNAVVRTTGVVTSNAGHAGVQAAGEAAKNPELVKHAMTGMP